MWAEASKHIQAEVKTHLVQPLMDAFGLAPAGRSQIEAIAALTAGVSFLRHSMRHSIETPGLRSLDAGQLTELLTPAVQALLDSASRR
jgi:hypothetical protein